jgi:uncharacterized protein (DUF305 family)
MLKKLVALLVVSLVTVVISADAPVDGRLGRAAVRFMEGMMDHHQMALDMANDCLAKAGDEVKAICEAVIAAQTPEIEMMQGWLLEWYNIDYSTMSIIEMNAMMSDDEGHSMSGMEMPATDPAMMMGMFAGLNRLEGRDYDIAWLESMIDHHGDALHMSERLLERLGDEGHEPLRTLAQNIIATQTAEIEMMENLIVSLSE